MWEEEIKKEKIVGLNYAIKTNRRVFNTCNNIVAIVVQRFKLFPTATKKERKNVDRIKLFLDPLRDPKQNLLNMNISIQFSLSS